MCKKEQKKVNIKPRSLFFQSVLCGEQDTTGFFCLWLKFSTFPGKFPAVAVDFVQLNFMFTKKSKLDLGKQLRFTFFLRENDENFVLRNRSARYL